MELHLADKLEDEMDILMQMMERDDDSAEHVTLCVQQAKRVKTASTLLVRALAAHRDQVLQR